MTPPLRHDWPLILAYHSVSDSRSDGLAVHPDAFEAQIAWLARRGYRSTTLAEFQARPHSGSEPVVIVTFDDGYADNYTRAVPVLERHGFRATFFVVSDYVGGERLLPWDLPKRGELGDPDPYRVLDWCQLREMADRGFEIGSHSCSHPRRLTALARDQRWDEVSRSRRDLENGLGRPVVSFCYPRGELDADLTRLVEEAGYGCAVVTPSRWGLPLTRFTLRRMGIYHGSTPRIFRLKTKRWVRRGYELRHWLRGRS